MYSVLYEKRSLVVVWENNTAYYYVKIYSDDMHFTVLF